MCCKSGKRLSLASALSRSGNLHTLCIHTLTLNYLVTSLNSGTFAFRGSAVGVTQKKMKEQLFCLRIRKISGKLPSSSEVMGLNLPLCPGSFQQRGWLLVTLKFFVLLKAKIKAWLDFKVLQWEAMFIKLKGEHLEYQVVNEPQNITNRAFFSRQSGTTARISWSYCLKGQTCSN